MFGTQEARDRAAPDTVALMTQGLARLDHVPGDVWMWGWTQLACDAAERMAPDVGAARRRGGAGRRGVSSCPALGARARRGGAVPWSMPAQRLAPQVVR